MKAKILELLKSRNEYVSGQELCELFGVSRTAVWKAMNSLKDSGYEIESVPNKGYRLVKSPDVLLSEEIKSILKSQWLGHEILYFQDIDSTNSEIKRQAEKGAQEGLLAISEHQSAGRGRRGRSWESPAGSGIWMSYLLKPDIAPAKASMLTLVAALACAESIRDNLGLKVGIKWPNDIVINGKKAVGILTELSAEVDYVNYIVVGIGINANMREFPEEIAAIATSLAIESGADVARSKIVATFCERFEKYYEIFCREGNLSSLRQTYEAMLVNCGAKVCVKAAEGDYVRKALGINEYGELLVEDTDGRIEAIRAGEVSVRGIYGYV